MAFVVADRVQETGTVSSGTGTVNLAGAVLGYQSFISGIGSTNTTYYTIYDPAAYTWEVGLGTVTAGSPNTLARTTVYANSAGTQPSKISFSTSNTLTVFVTYPAEIAIYTAASASLNSLTLTSSITGSSNKGALNYGTLTYSDTNIFESYQTSVNSYAQIVIQNSSAGTAASADVVVSSDSGTSTTNYGNFGINSTGYTGTGPLNSPSMVYLYSQSYDLTIGTNTANAIHFTINNAATDAMTINTTGSIAINGQTGSLGQVLISQGSSTPPSWGNAGGNLVVTDFTATAGQTTFSVTYVVGTVSVYRNGIKLGLADFTATNGTSVVLSTGAVVGDLIEIESFTTLTLYSSITAQNFSGNGSTTAFTMNVNPANSASVLVAINGVTQDPSNYTVAGTTLTFSTAPATGTNNISVRYLGVPSTTSVSSFSAGTTGFSPTSAASGAVTLSGTLVVANGGTGLTTLATGYIPYGAGTAALNSSSTFTFDGTTLTSPAISLTASALTSSNTSNLGIGGTLSFSDTGIIAHSVATTNGYLQAVIQNKSAGGLASAEFIAYNDSGTASTNYATVGINSSGYSGTGSINGPGYGYFLTGSTDLVLGTVGNNAIHFVVNSGATDAVTIANTKAVAFNGSYGSSGQVLTSQGSGAAPIWASSSAPSVTYLVVGGGGGGGSRFAGGGGAGGYLTGTNGVLPATAYTVTVGAGGAGGVASGGGGTGGAGQGSGGSASSFQALSTSASGGGGGGCGDSANGSGGGSGGGGAGRFASSGGSGTSGQGNSGGGGTGAIMAGSDTYRGAGGGGAGGAGAAPTTSSPYGGDGGVGLANSISGSSVYYAGGGGAGTGSGVPGEATQTPAPGGNGGGGAGANRPTGPTAGTTNTGGGGGGGTYNGSNGVGGAGGSGIIIISYSNVYKLATATGTYTQTNVGGNYIYTFTGSGTITF
jgi:hypothetical protein